MKKHQKSKSDGPAAKLYSCGLCPSKMSKNEAWRGDLEAAFSLFNIRRKQHKRICISCGELLPYLIDDALESWNVTRPWLRLKAPPRDQLFGTSILDPRLCEEYFDKCVTARNDENAAEQIAQLLTDFFVRYPLEWCCSGWKSDFISDLILGRLPTSMDKSASQIAEEWVRQYWKEVGVTLAPIGNSESRVAAELAADELETFHLMDELPYRMRRAPPYSSFAEYVEWLNRNWRRIPNDLGRAGMITFAINEYCKDRASSRNTTAAEVIPKPMLARLTALFTHLYLRPERRNHRKITPYRVILEFVAKNHGVSSGLVGKVRADRANILKALKEK